jgi:hypothetical protein
MSEGRARVIRGRKGGVGGSGGGGFTRVLRGVQGLPFPAAQGGVTV